VTTTDLRPPGIFGWRPGSSERSTVDFSVTFPLAGIRRRGDYPRFELPQGGAAVVALQLPTVFVRGVKRAIDIALSLIALVCLLPVLLTAALAVKVTSPGPILFRQVRVGLSGRTFRVLKFRSMTQDAESSVAELMADNGGFVPFCKIQNDPRVTAVGRFLRRTSIDELPQLVNVLKGQMSLVGPRPLPEAEAAQFALQHCRRVLVKPGMTGLWQISGRSDLVWHDAVRLDMKYADSWTLRGDLVIMLKTIRVVLTSHGAY
jgi:lipopolysaccharide/colanic/teichoic acid biosynthesis glycosyltransferase